MNVSNHHLIFLQNPCLNVLCTTAVVKYLDDEKIFHSEQLGFQNGHSVEYEIFQLADRIYKSCGIGKYTVSIFPTCERH